MEATRLAAFIASKVCHDLVSPVASVSTALDFLKDDTSEEMKAQAEELLQSSAQRTSDNLQFLRYAFGSMGMHDGVADFHEARSIINAYVSYHKPELEWDVDVERISFSHVRIVMNLVLLGIDCLARGGTMLVIMRQTSDGVHITLHGKGDRAKLKPDVEAAIAGRDPQDGWNARNIQPYFARTLVVEHGGTISVGAGEGEVTVTVNGLGAATE